MKAYVVRVLAVFSLLTLFVIGVDWILETTEFPSYVLGDAFEWPGMRNIGPHVSTVLIGVAAVLLPILTACAWVLLGRDDSIRISAEKGNVINLAPSAVERVIRREVRSNVPEVGRVDALASQGSSRRVKVTVRVAVSDRRPVPSVERQVREETAKVLQHLLGVADTSLIRVVVYDVQEARRRSRPKDSPPGKKERQRPSLFGGRSEDAGAEEKTPDAPKAEAKVELAGEASDAASGAKSS